MGFIHPNVSSSNVFIDIAVNIPARLSKPGRIVEKVQRGKAEPLCQPVLSDVEALREQHILGILVNPSPQAVDRLPHQQRGGNVQGEAEKERLHINDSGWGEVGQEVVDMLFEVTEILILRPNKLLAQEFSRMLPRRPFLCEDTSSDERSKDFSPDAQSIVCIWRLDMGNETKVRNTGQ